jgi:hypothetical protein
MSSFFNEMCRIMGISMSHTSSYHPMSNRHVERLHRVLHPALSHYVNQAHTDWDLRVAFSEWHIILYRILPRDIALITSSTVEK